MDIFSAIGGVVSSIFGGGNSSKNSATKNSVNPTPPEQAFNNVLRDIQASNATEAALAAERDREESMRDFLIAGGVGLGLIAILIIVVKK